MILQSFLPALFDNYLAFVTMLVVLVALIGLGSRSLAIAAFGGYMTFTYIAITTQTPLFINILYVTLVLTFIGFGFKLWRLEFGGSM